MTYNEYRSQKAVGTIDLRKVAHDTISTKILMDIANTCEDGNVLMTVILNRKTPVQALMLIIFNPILHRELHIAAAQHPNVSLDVLDRWMKLNYIRNCDAICKHYRNLQIAAGVPDDQLLLSSPFNPRPEYIQNLHYIMKQVASYNKNKSNTPCTVQQTFTTTVVTTPGQLLYYHHLSGSFQQVSNIEYSLPLISTNINANLCGVSDDTESSIGSKSINT